MDVRIIYLSQTGNTYKVARVMADVFLEEDHAVRLIPLKDASVDQAVNGNLLGIGTPCFSSQAPQPVIRFIKSLPTLEGQKAFVFATCGGAPGRVLLDMRNGLHQKGGDVIGCSLFRGEVHHPAPSLSGRFPGRPDAEDLDQARRFARAVCTQISEPGSVTFPLVPSIKRWGFYELLGTVLFDTNLRIFLPEPRLTQENCDQCELCAEECPTQNINLDPYPVFKGDCVRCYHCYNACPSRAFSANWQFSNPILWFLYNRTFIRWFGDLEPGEQIDKETRVERK